MDLLWDTSHVQLKLSDMCLFVSLSICVCLCESDITSKRSMSTVSSDASGSRTRNAWLQHFFSSMIRFIKLPILPFTPFRRIHNNKTATINDHHQFIIKINKKLSTNAMPVCIWSDISS